ncbi:hypothetical protein [Furfurilactobacillus entadae]|uniref:hypothetical protein n=1 Tax=Furfurilactobacillus entadae TaxID=2922307 RepID=UPI0035E622AC
MTQPIDIRPILLRTAAELLAGGPTTQFGYTYSGEEAVQKGYDLVAIVQYFDRQFSHK